MDFPWLRIHTKANSLGMFVISETVYEATSVDRGVAKASVEVATIEPKATVVQDQIGLRIANVTLESPHPLGVHPSATPAVVPTQVPSANYTPTRVPLSPPMLAASTPSPFASNAVLTPTPAPNPTATNDLSADRPPDIVPSISPEATLAPPLPSPLPTRTATEIPAPRHRLFINGRQVLPGDVDFHVPLGVLRIDPLPGPDGAYEINDSVKFEVHPSYEDVELQVSGADRTEEFTVHVRVNTDRFVTVYIGLIPTPTPEVESGTADAPRPLNTFRPDLVPGPTTGATPMPASAIDTAEAASLSNIPVSVSHPATPALTPTLTPTPTPTPTPDPTATLELPAEPTLVLQSEPAPVEAAIHPAGGRIAFQTEKEGNSEIYMMGCDGSEPVNLTNHIAEDRHPSWSTDGRIAFISDRDAEEGVDNQYDVYLLDLEMENISRLTEIEGNIHSPALSPDGRKVAFVSDEEGKSEVLLLDVTSGSISNFTKDPASDLDPAWASDSERLLFASDRDGDFDIYIAEIDGSSLINVTDSDEDDEEAFNDRWPDLGVYEFEDQIIFSSDRDGNWEVYTLELEGNDLVRATNNSALDVSPSWGPSGDEFVFHTNRDKRMELYTAANAFGDGQGRVSDSGSNDDSHPDWEPVLDPEYCGEPIATSVAIPTPSPALLPQPTPTPTPTDTPTPTPTDTPTPTPRTHRPRRQRTHRPRRQRTRRRRLRRTRRRRLRRTRRRRLRRTRRRRLRRTRRRRLRRTRRRRLRRTRRLRLRRQRRRRPRPQRQRARRPQRQRTRQPQPQRTRRPRPQRTRLPRRRRTRLPRRRRTRRPRRRPRPQRTRRPRRRRTRRPRPQRTRRPRRRRTRRPRRRRTRQPRRRPPNR